MTRHLSKCLERKLLTLPKNARHNFVWAACCNNMYLFAQILAITGQLPKHMISHLVNDLILKPQRETYHHPMADHPNNATLNGVGIYIDENTLRPVRAMLAWDKTFADAHAADKRAAGNGGPSEFSKRYPRKEPSNSELGGWNGVFPSLTLCVGVAVSKLGNSDCLVQPDGAFAWTERTMAKLGHEPVINA